MFVFAFTYFFNKCTIFLSELLIVAVALIHLDTHTHICIHKCIHMCVCEHLPWVCQGKLFKTTFCYPIWSLQQKIYSCLCASVPQTATNNPLTFLFQWGVKWGVIKELRYISHKIVIPQVKILTTRENYDLRVNIMRFYDNILSLKVKVVKWFILKHLFLTSQYIMKALLLTDSVDICVKDWICVILMFLFSS